jgi:DNA-directed RNA polymerase specialized sigma24 family protein
MHLGGASNQKIAEWMGCTTNAVGKLLAQAREKQGIGIEK